MPDTITPYQAIKRMRELTQAGVPFSFEFLSFNSTKNTSDGHRAVKSAQLRQGLRSDKSGKAHILIAYTDYTGGELPRFFNLPLLFKFNQYIVKP